MIDSRIRDGRSSDAGMDVVLFSIRTFSRLTRGCCGVLSDLQSAADSSQHSTHSGTCVEPGGALTQRLHTLPDAELARVITAWPHLPPHVRQTIATLIAAAAPGLAQGERFDA